MDRLASHLFFDIANFVSTNKTVWFGVSWDICNNAPLVSHIPDNDKCALSILRWNSAVIHRPKNDNCPVCFGDDKKRTVSEDRLRSRKIKPIPSQLKPTEICRILQSRFWIWPDETNNHVTDIFTNHDALLWACKHSHAQHMIQFLKDWPSVDKCLSLDDLCDHDNRILGKVSTRGQVELLNFFKDWLCTSPDDSFNKKLVRQCNMFGLDYNYKKEEALDIPLQHCMELAAFHGRLEVCKLLKSWMLDYLSPEQFLEALRSNNNLALRWATGNGHLHILQFLKECGLTIRDVRDDDNYALKHAAQNGFLAVFQFLIGWEDKDGSRLTLDDLRCSNFYVLRLAAGSGHLHILQCLKDYGLTFNDLNVKDLDYVRRNALSRAAAHGHLEIVNFLIHWDNLTGTSTRCSLADEETRCSVLDVRKANELGHEVDVGFANEETRRDQRSLQKGEAHFVADIRYEDNFALRWAATNGHLHMLKFLKEMGLTIQDVRAEFNFALRHAASGGHLEVLQFLKDWRDVDGEKSMIVPWGPTYGGHDLVGPKARLTLEDVRMYNCQVVRNAASGGHIHILQFLKDWRDATDAVHLKNEKDAERLRDGLDTDCLTIADFHSAGVLMEAITYGHVNVLQFLKDWADDNNAKFLLRDNDHRALSAAITHGQLNVIKFLLDQWRSMDGLIIQYLRSSDNHVLRWAARGGHLHILKYIKNWKDPVSGQGLTVEDLHTDNDFAFRHAARNGHLDVCRFLKRWVCKSAATFEGGDTEFLSMIRVKNNSAFRKAASNGHLGVCRFLKECGLTIADVRAKDNWALKRACTNGKIDVALFLLNWGRTCNSGRQCCLGLKDLRAGNNRAFRKAAHYGKAELCDLLMSWRDPYGNGLTLEDVRSVDNYALRKAAQNNRLSVLKLLKKLGLTIQDVRSQDNFALRQAVKYGNVNVCHFLKNWVTTREDGTQSRLTIQDVRANNNEALLECCHVNVRLLKFLLGWRDPVEESGKNVSIGRLTLSDLRIRNNRLLRKAARTSNFEMLQILKDWRDVSSGDRLTANDLRAKNNAALKEAAEWNRIEVCQFLKDWRFDTKENNSPDDSSLGLTREDARIVFSRLNKPYSHSNHSSLSLNTCKFFEKWLSDYNP